VSRVLVPMAKVELIGPKSKFFEVVSLIHEQGKLHIEDLTKKISSGEVPLDKMEVVANQQTEQDRMEDLLIRVRGIIKALHLPGVTIDEAKRQEEYLRLWKMDIRSLADEVTDVVQEVEGKTSELANGRNALEGEIELLARYEPILQKVQPLAKQIVTTGAFDSVALLFERRYKAALDQLKAELDTITHKQCEIVSTDVDDETTAAIVVFNRSYAEPVHKFLAMENVNQIRLPSDFQDMPFDMAYEVIKERRKALPDKLAVVRGEIEKMSQEWYLKLATIRDVLTDKIDEIKAIPKFGQTEYAFVVTGWIPVDDLKALRKTIIEHFGDDIIITQKDITEQEFEDIPVALRNSKQVAPFAALLPQLSGGLPKYGTIDPTWMIALFYPFVFGMIVGDIGMGAIMLGVVLYLRWRYKSNDGVQLATSILGPAATMAIAFGFIYGEFFGNIFGSGVLNLIRQIHIGPISLPFERTRPEMIMTFMFIAVGVGFVQVAMGLVLGIVNGIRTKHIRHVYEKGGILTFVVTLPLLILAGVFATNMGGTVALIVESVLALVMMLGFLFAFKGGGILGIIDSIEAIGHIASYIRIMAVGLAGAIFAEAVNEMAQKMGNVVVGLLIAILLHSLNLALAAFTPNIHALRLNFLEFFGKFYEAGKQEYKPFHKSGGEENA
jgi:V/A-type H+/Na+-transporting ATPase subunit I